MPTIGRLAAIAFGLIVFVGANEQTSAQQGVEIDCSAFQRQSDGSWVAIRTTTIKIGTNTITINGRPGGTINGLDIQEAITKQCSNSQMRAGKPVYANTNWRKTLQTSDECVARGRDLVKDFPWKSVAGETVYASSDGYTFIIRCTPQQMIFFAVVGPPDGTPERERAAKGLFDRIFGQW